MNILMIGLYPPHIGGIASYVFNLRQSLENQGHSVCVVTYGNSSLPHVYGTPVTRRWRGLSFLLWGTKRAYQIVRERDIHVVHAHYLVPPGMVGVSMKLLTGVPLVVTCHGSDIFLFSQGWKKVISQLVINHSDCITTNSQATRKAVQSLGAASPVYVPSGVDNSLFKPLGLNREAVTYVGALQQVKGVDTFLRAMKGIPEKVWIVGDGPQRPYLERLARNLHLSCTFWGYRTDIPELMNRSKIIVLPSRHEGFGLTVLEAMACGTPVIGRKTGGIPEIITENNGILFDTESELHDAIQRLLSDTVLWEEIQNEGLNTAAQWSWNRTARIYSDLYSRLR
jgi:glycosyltransferase involved in cell wall biosynthesis